VKLSDILAGGHNKLFINSHEKAINFEAVNPSVKNTGRKQEKDIWEGL